MPNEVKLLPCDVKLPPATTIVAGCKLSTLLEALYARGMTRPTTVVTDEVVERVARAISNAAWDNMRMQGFSGGWDHDELGRAIARAAIASMPTVVTGEQPESVGDHALPPSGLSRDASQAKPAAAIARKNP